MRWASLGRAREVQQLVMPLLVRTLRYGSTTTTVATTWTGRDSLTIGVVHTDTRLPTARLLESTWRPSGRATRVSGYTLTQTLSYSKWRRVAESTTTK